MMNASPSPLSPLGHPPSSSSLSSPDPAANSQQQIGEPSLHNNHHDTAATQNSGAASMSTTNTRKTFKTEYKSNFRPFDQYAYDEVTDSFVKQPGSVSSPISASRSNQDLAGADGSSATGAHQPVTINTLEADAFGPVNNGGHYSNASSEPWYKEVVKRNEKANEYRFKSEVGHNSPLLNLTTTTTTTTITRAESPHRMAGSPSIVGSGGAESIAGGDGLQPPTASVAGSDEQSEIASQSDNQQPHKQQPYRFTHHDYKRDHMIADMAKHNNYALPREHVEPMPRRGQAASAQVGTGRSSARPTTARSAAGASVRARSQSSRRQPISSAKVAQSSSAAKSNQTTPTRTIASRAATAKVTSSTTTSTTKSITSRVAPVSRPSEKSAATTASPSNGVGSNNKSTAPSSAAKRTPITASSRLTSAKLTNGTSPSVRQTATVGSASKRPTTTTTPITASKPLARATPTAQRTPVSAPKSGTSQAMATSATRRTPLTASARPTTAAAVGRSPATPMARGKLGAESSKPTPSPVPKSSATTAVKSIKTRKAQLAAQEASVATTAAAAGLVGASAAIASAASLEPTNDKQTSEAPPTLADRENELVDSANRLIESDNITQQQQQEPLQEMMLQQEEYAVSSEPNLIFNTTEAGNMLADEIAQAERAAMSATKTQVEEVVPLEPELEFEHIQQQQHQQVEEEAMIVPATEQSNELLKKEESMVGEESTVAKESKAAKEVESIDSTDDSDDDDREKLVGSKELVNGLAGGLVSAEDRFDSSEREMSSEMNADNGQQTAASGDVDVPYDHHQQHHHPEQNYECDEPYSIMPTTSEETGGQVGDKFVVELPEMDGTRYKERGHDDLMSSSSSSDSDGESELNHQAQQKQPLDDSHSDDDVKQRNDDDGLIQHTSVKMESKDLIDSSPALISANMTFQDNGREFKDLIDSSPALNSANVTYQDSEKGSKDLFDSSPALTSVNMTFQDNRRESKDLIDSSPALNSANVTYQDSEKDSKDLLDSSPALISANLMSQDSEFDASPAAVDLLADSLSKVTVTNSQTETVATTATTTIQDSNLVQPGAIEPVDTQLHGESTGDGEAVDHYKDGSKTIDLLHSSHEQIVAPEELHSTMPTAPGGETGQAEDKSVDELPEMEETRHKEREHSDLMFNGDSSGTSDSDGDGDGDSKLNLQAEQKQPSGDGHSDYDEKQQKDDDDLIQYTSINKESKDLIDSSPALISTNATFRDRELDASPAVDLMSDSSSTVTVTKSHTETFEVTTTIQGSNLVHGALETKDTPLQGEGTGDGKVDDHHNDDKSTTFDLLHTSQKPIVALDESDSESSDSRSENGSERSAAKKELLMNVTDLPADQ